jgi:tryptophanyl-tRNA synthetase
VELTREIARRFNHVFGRESGFEEKAQEAVKKLGGKRARLYSDLRDRFQEKGDEVALEQAKALVQEAQNLTMDDRERLFGFLEGARRLILVEPQALLTEASRMPGLDGQKMSKSYGNTIAMREPTDNIVQKMRKMPTDPARVRRADVGNPERCPVWQLHQVYSDEARKKWVSAGCTSAGIGCLECKQPLIDAVLEEQKEFIERARPYEEDPDLLRSIVADGSEKAREMARQTMRDVREAMGLDYS